MPRTKNNGVGYRFFDGENVSLVKPDPSTRKKTGFSKLDTRDIDPINLTYQLALLGATEMQIAAALDVSISCVENWKRTRVEFANALRAGKEMADSEIANSLFQRAKGYTHPDMHIAVLKDRLTGQVEVVETPIVKHYPPDTTACIFWLKNRQRNIWRDVNRTEHTGVDGKPIEQKISRDTLDLSLLNDQELALAETLGLITAGEEKVGGSRGRN
jgi:hypothetical protein